MLNKADKELSTEPSPITYKYAGFSIKVVTIAALPLYALWIWTIVTTNRPWVRLLSVLVVPFVVAVNVRGLLRLGETITLENEGIVNRSRFATKLIPWNEIVKVATYTSLLERDCFRIESVSGVRISVSENLIDYEGLYRRVMQRVSDIDAFYPPNTSFAGLGESSVEINARLSKGAYETRRCPTCGSGEFVALDGFLGEFYQSCTNCGLIFQQDSFQEKGLRRQTIARLLLALRVIIGSAYYALLFTAAFLFILGATYIVLWSVMNFLILPSFHASQFSIMDSLNLARLGLPSAFISMFILILLFRYFPVRFPPSMFRAVTSPKKNRIKK